MEDHKKQALRLSLLGAPVDAIAAALENQGVDSRAVSKDIESVLTLWRRNAHLRQMAERHAFWTLSVKRQLRRSEAPIAIAEVNGMPPASAFFEQYFFRNKPLVMRNVLSSWRAFDGWSFEQLLKHYGHCQIEIQDSRSDRLDHLINPDAYKQVTSFADFLLRVQRDRSDSFYLVAHNREGLGDLRTLLSNISPMPEIFSEKSAQESYLWIGPAGTVTQLHYDKANVLNCQVVGTKTFYLIPPEDACFVYNEIGVFSSVDAADPNLNTYPLFAFAEKSDITLNEGDAIFIPVGWWHQVMALTPTIAVSFSRFAKCYPILSED